MGVTRLLRSFLSSFEVVVVVCLTAKGEDSAAEAREGDLGGVWLRPGGSRKRLRPVGVPERAGVVDRGVCCRIDDEDEEAPFGGGRGSVRGRDKGREEERAGVVEPPVSRTDDLTGDLVGDLACLTTGFSGILTIGGPLLVVSETRAVVSLGAAAVAKYDEDASK